MIVGIFSNKYKDKDLSVTKSIMSLLIDNGMTVLLYKDIAKELNEKNYFDFSSKVKMDAMITIGGDGTILRTAIYCAENAIPILGINLGKVGFMSELEKGELKEVINLLKSKDYILENRMMLKITLKNKTYNALNEAVVDRSAFSKMILLDVEINEQFVDNYYCDGFIVCTPTGSTAYSLSAGGAVISPNANVIGLTPINSHSLHSRPIIINETEKIAIKVGLNGTANLVIDGETVAALDGGDSINIEKSNLFASFIRLKSSNFYSKLLFKLNKWSVTRQEDIQ